MSVFPIPTGYHSITPYLIVKDANTAIDFYCRAFGATELMRLNMPGGGIGHAEVKIGDSPVMLADEMPEMGALAPQEGILPPVSILIYVEDVDTIFQQAVAAGAEVIRPLVDQFYGDRSGTLKDPFGHQWTVATHTEDLTQEEIVKRMQALPT